MQFYPYIKVFHILLATTAVGFNASYGIWLSRAAKEPEYQSYTLRTIKILDDRFANPAYVLLLVTGLIMVGVSDWSIGDFWVSTAMGLWLVLALLGGFGYTPALRKQIALLEAGEGGSAEFEQAARRGKIIGMVLAVLVLVIIYLMVVKPSP